MSIRLTETYEVGEWEKNASEKVKVSIGPYRGHTLLSFRVWYHPGEGKAEVATHKGLAIREAQIPEFEGALKRAKAVLAKHGEHVEDGEE